MLGVSCGGSSELVRPGVAPATGGRLRPNRSHTESVLTTRKSAVLQSLRSIRPIVDPVQGGIQNRTHNPLVAGSSPARPTVKRLVRRIAGR
jgi:hypothetical protein